MTRYFQRILDEHVEQFVAAGYVDEGTRVHFPSLAQPEAVVEWQGEGEPPRVERRERSK